MTKVFKISFHGFVIQSTGRGSRRSKFHVDIWCLALSSHYWVNRASSGIILLLTCTLISQPAKSVYNEQNLQSDLKFHSANTEEKKQNSLSSRNTT